MGRRKLTAWGHFARALLAWNELFSIPIGVALFALSPALFRWIDPTAGTFDVGTLHAVVFAVAAFCVLKGAAWLTLWLDFPGIYKWLDDRMEEEILPNGMEEEKGCEEKGSSWRRARLLLALFALYLLPLVAMTMVLL